MKMAIKARMGQTKSYVSKPRHPNFKKFLLSKSSQPNSKASDEKQAKAKIGKSSWHLSLRKKAILAFVIMAVILVSVFASVPLKDSSSTSNIQGDDSNPVASPSATAPPTEKKNNNNNVFAGIVQALTPIGQELVPTKPKGVIELSQGKMNSSIWKVVAANAWKYFAPGVGVDPNTGLPGAGLGYPYFTDWDLGVYIQAVIDANKTGLISNDGAWGSSARLEKVIQFLETRDLNSYGYPFWFYDAANGKNYKALSDTTSETVDIVDTGRLFVALNNLRNFNSSLTQRINNIVLYGQNYNRSNYAALVNSIKTQSTSASIYSYFYVSGFASFWPAQLSTVPDAILTNMYMANVTTPEGINLPKADISCEPLLCAYFDLDHNPKLAALVNQVYLAHEARFNATNMYVAFSEGNTYDCFIYEWVATSDGRTWVIERVGDHSTLDINPIIYNKVALSFLAVYNTTFAYWMSVYLEQSLPLPTSGYYDGADYNDIDYLRNLIEVVGSNTNALIISAAAYAILNNA